MGGDALLEIITDNPAIFMRPDVHVRVLRMPGHTYQVRENDRTSNFYSASFINKTGREYDLSIKCETKGAKVTVAGNTGKLKAGEKKKIVFFVEVPAGFKENSVKLKFFGDEKVIEETSTSFITP